MEEKAPEKSKGKPKPKPAEKPKKGVCKVCGFSAPKGSEFCLLHTPPPWRSERTEEVSTGSEEEKDKIAAIAQGAGGTRQIPAKIGAPKRPEESYGMMDISGRKVFFHEDLWQTVLFMRKQGADPTTITEETGIPFGCLVEFISILKKVAKQIAEGKKPDKEIPQWMRIGAMQWHHSGKFILGKIMQAHIYKALRGDMQSTNFVYNQEEELLGEPPARKPSEKPEEDVDPVQALKKLIADEGEPEPEALSMPKPTVVEHKEDE